MVNSDQTWSRGLDLYNVAFLKFSENWTKPKFTYGVSLGSDTWYLNNIDEKIAKNLLRNFSGLSVREKSLAFLIEKHLGFKAKIVLDPTLIINKKYYLDLIKNYKSVLINQNNKEDFIFAYILTKSNEINEYLKYVEKILNIKIYYLTIFIDNQVQEFLYGVTNCKGVIPDSYHGTLFSIIFNFLNLH